MLQSKNFRLRTRRSIVLDFHNLRLTKVVPTTIGSKLVDLFRESLLELIVLTELLETTLECP
ncbi:hypothetical protein GCM10020366_11370 [Saccharopolyspora gregorii]|uniref:Uncharacterized protein n=1 Tax=Saccharopolyspora gregorii TaxID=33914 RepID=A0ABP6RLF1_9PSEU